VDFQCLSICIAAFNEGPFILETIRELLQALPGAEIIVVNDGSTDDTAEVLGQVPEITVLTHGRNIGYGGALKSAMRIATRDIIVWCDADGQHRPADLIKVAAPIISGERDAVIGVRDAHSDRPLTRLPGKWLIRHIAEMVVGTRIPDLNSGLRAFRREVIARYHHLLPDGFSASTTSTLLLIKQEPRLGYVTITTRKRLGKSSVRIIRDGWRTLKLILHILILFEAFNFFMILALLQIIPAVVYGLYIALTVRHGLPILAATVIISGVLTFFMGILCDQIVAMRKEKLSK